MKFRMFTDAVRKGVKIGVNVDEVERIETADKDAGTTYIIFKRKTYGEENDPGFGCLEVGEDFDTVLARLNTIAE